jgi:hypothetical protein
VHDVCCVTRGSKSQMRCCGGTQRSVFTLLTGVYPTRVNRAAEERTKQSYLRKLEECVYTDPRRGYVYHPQLCPGEMLFRVRPAKWYFCRL